MPVCQAVNQSGAPHFLLVHNSKTFVLAKTRILATGGRINVGFLCGVSDSPANTIALPNERGGPMGRPWLALCLLFFYPWCLGGYVGNHTLADG